MAFFNQPFSSEPTLVGNSPRLRHVQRMVDKLAAGRWPALILGETGTGKEVVARSIHAANPVGALPLAVCSVREHGEPEPTPGLPSRRNEPPALAVCSRLTG